MIKDNYLDGCCPDCLENIPDNAEDGDECKNCEHIFYDKLDICEQCRKLGENTCGNDIEHRCFELKD